jgi:hypothetical protein
MKLVLGVSATRRDYFTNETVLATATISTGGCGKALRTIRL